MHIGHVSGKREVVQIDVLSITTLALTMVNGRVRLFGCCNDAVVQFKPLNPAQQPVSPASGVCVADSAEAPERFDHTFILASGSVVCDTDMSFDKE